MSEKFRLYVGLEIDGVWYNYAECKEIEGGVLALLDSGDKSAVGRLRNLINNSVDYIYTDPAMEDKAKEYKLGEHDAGLFKIDDAWKIGMELQKQFLDVDEPVFKESFFCPVCSVRGREIYTTVEDSWAKLIEDGEVDEHFLESPDCSITTELPQGLHISDSNAVARGVYKILKREPVTLDELQKIVNIPGIMDNEVNFLGAVWDTQIKEIHGMSPRDLKILKRNPRDSFTKKYLKNKDDVNKIMEDKFPVGLDAQYRSITCKNCSAEVGGGLDFTNFFDFVLPKTLNQNTAIRNEV